MERIGNKVSYIRKPLAKYSFVALGLFAAAAVFAGVSLWIGYDTRGNVPLYAAALGFCSLITAVSSVAYGIFSFFEQGKNYLLAKLSLAASGMLLFVWAIMIVVAL